MAIQQVKAKVTSGDRKDEEFVVNIDLPESLEEAKDRYGEPLVFSYFNADLAIAVQAFVRTQIKKDGATAEAVQTAVDEWKPGMKVRGKSVTEKARDLLGKLSDEDRAELIASLTA